MIEIKKETKRQPNTVTAEDIVVNLGNREWRLNNLYFIKDENGNKVLFKLNEHQAFLLANLWWLNIIPKARQLGITTFFTILYLDAILFSRNKEACIIVHKQEDQKKIFKNKIKYAWEHMHPWVRQNIGEPETNNAWELRWPAPHGGIISTTLSNRSGTAQFLHISEFGPICKHAPEKAEEIVTGSLNTVHKGNMVSIESTAAGQEGSFFDFCQEAKRLHDEGNPLSEMDYKLFFFPWHDKDEYRTDPKNVVITSEMKEYFKTLENKHKVFLDPSQKAWYVKKQKTQREKMFQEFPSVFEECFRAIIEGSYYQKEMTKVYEQNRIRKVLPDPNIEVETWWDLGMSDLTVILLTQTVGDEIRFIDMYANNGYPLSHYYDWLKERKEQNQYRYGRHHLPHDIDVRDLSTGISRKQTLFNLGLRNIIVGSKANIADGIEGVRSMFFRFVFDEENCADLHKHLFSYRRDFNKKLGTFNEKPRHDTSSHYCDPVRLMPELWRPPIPQLHDIENPQERVQAFFG